MRNSPAIDTQRRFLVPVTLADTRVIEALVLTRDGQIEQVTLPPAFDVTNEILAQIETWLQARPD